jgi:hypothetical protein
MKKKAAHSIGTERESSLHRALKFRCTGPGGRTEVKAAGFVADGVSAGGEYIEVQTGSFGPLREKVKALAGHGAVKIVHPVIISKYIEVFNQQGTRQYRRKSPRRGSPWDLFNALLYAPELPLFPGITIELALVDVTEKRVQDGKGSWRRKGVSIADRELCAWYGSITLQQPADYRRFAPFAAGEEFTVRLLGKKTGVTAEIARRTLYVLTKIGVVTRVGKQGNAYVYTIKE